MPVVVTVEGGWSRRTGEEGKYTIIDQTWIKNGEFPCFHKPFEIYKTIDNIENIENKVI